MSHTTQAKTRLCLRRDGRLFSCLVYFGDFQVEEEEQPKNSACIARIPGAP